MGEIIFLKQNGRVGRALPNKDHISGLLFYLFPTDTTPDGWSPAEPKKISSVKDAETKNIVNSGVTGIIHYHITEFFRLAPDAELWVMIGPSYAPDFSEVVSFVNFTNGDMRQVGIYTKEPLVPTMISELQSKLIICENEHKPLSAILSADISLLETSTLPDLRSLGATKVSVVIAQDGANTGAQKFIEDTHSIGAIGAVIASVANASVHENIGWVEKFKVSEKEFDVPALANGGLIKNLMLSEINSLNTKGYIFLIKHVGIEGSYWNDSHCAVSLTNDYAYIENNRTIDKAIRGIRTYLIPKINSPVSVTSGGAIAIETIKVLENLARIPLTQMVSNDELSDFNVAIDPVQDVLSNSKIIVTVNLTIKGVARTIQVEIGF